MIALCEEAHVFMRACCWVFIREKTFACGLVHESKPHSLYPVHFILNLAIFENWKWTLWVRSLQSTMFSRNYSRVIQINEKMYFILIVLKLCLFLMVLKRMLTNWSDIKIWLDKLVSDIQICLYKLGSIKCNWINWEVILKHGLINW
jgi:hypothetical protein